MKDFISSQISDNNWKILTKYQTYNKGFDELAEWAIEDDCIVLIELTEPIKNEYYIAICLSINDFQ